MTIRTVPARVEELLAHWRRHLRLLAYEVELERVSPLAVSDCSGAIGHELVAIRCDHDDLRAVIFHTRDLEEEDIVHELLHLRHPDWSEEQVNREMDALSGAESRVGERSAA